MQVVTEQFALGAAHEAFAEDGAGAGHCGHGWGGASRIQDLRQF
jgi:hypothetical protein